MLKRLKIIKKILIIDMLMISLLSCQKTPKNITENENGIKVEKKETMAMIESDNLKTIEELQIPDYIQTSFEGVDYKVTIDCDVKRTKQEVTSGQLVPLDISLVKIKDILNPSADWIAREEGYYVFQSNDQLKDSSDYLVRLEKSRDGYTEYDVGYNENFPAMTEVVNKENQTDEMKEYSKKCERYANDILEQLNMNCKVMDETFFAAEDRWYANYRLQFLIDNIPICDYFKMDLSKNNLKKILGEITVTDTQIGNLYFIGNYSEKTKQRINLLDWNLIMSCFKSLIEEGTIKYKINNIYVSKIQLEYYVLDDWSYVPVWTFYIQRMDGEYPGVCINASTGDVMYAW